MRENIQRFQNIVGMQRDNSLPAYNTDQKEGQHVFECLNMRLAQDEDNTSWSFTTEKGTVRMKMSLEGLPIGNCKAGDDKWVLFTATIATPIVNRIYLFHYDSEYNNYVAELLYRGNLNMAYGNELKTLFSYENENVQKVYWTDGVNQCRFINIAASKEEREKWTYRINPFDFVPELTLREEVEIQKNNDASGMFEPGVLQYFLTYSNKYGQESSIFYTSPLLYTSVGDRAGMFSTNADSTSNSICNNSFTLKINNIQTEYDYINVYSILRTAKDDIPQAKQVAQIHISDYVSYQEQGEPVDPEYTYIVNTDSWHNQQEDKDSPIKGLLKGTATETAPSISIFKQIAGGDANTWKCVPVEVDENHMELQYKQTSSIKHTVPQGPYYKVTLASDEFLYINQYNSYTGEALIIRPAEGLEELYLYTSDLNTAWYITGFLTTPALHQRYQYMLSDVMYVRIDTQGNVEAEINQIEFTDTGTLGKYITPTDLFYKGGIPSSALAIEQKDNTLFLGDISTGQFSTDVHKIQGFDSFINSLSDSVSFSNVKTRQLSDSNKECLYLTSYDFKTFKQGEWYRLGIQLQDKYGKWTPALFIKDLQNTDFLNTFTEYTPTNQAPQYSVSTSSVSWKVPSLDVDIPQDGIIDRIFDAGYRKIRPVIVYPKYNERKVLMQGVLSPTVFRFKDMMLNRPYAQASWFFRPYPGFPVTDINSGGISPQEGVTHTYYNGKWMMVPEQANDTIWASTQFQKGETIYLVIYEPTIGQPDEPFVQSQDWTAENRRVKLNVDVPMYTVTVSGKKDIDHGALLKPLQPVIKTAYIQNDTLGDHQLIDQEDHPVVEPGNDNPSQEDPTVGGGGSKKHDTQADVEIIPASEAQLFVQGHRLPQAFASSLTVYVVKGTETSDVYIQTSVAQIQMNPHEIFKEEVMEEIFDDQGHSIDTYKDNVNFFKGHGAFLQYKHLHAIPGTCGYMIAPFYSSSTATASSSNRAEGIRAEIQDISVVPETIRGIGKSEMENHQIISNVDELGDTFFIDASIVTLNSPDLIADEAMKNINLDNTQLRITGFIPLTKTTSNIDIDVDIPQTTQMYQADFKNYPSSAIGFVKKTWDTQNFFLGGRIMPPMALWWDEISYRKNGNDNKDQVETGFLIYPWHKSGSISNSRNRTSFGSTSESDLVKYMAQWPSMTGKLKKKTISNTRYSPNSIYFKTDEGNLDTEGYKAYNTEGQLFNSDNVTLAKLPDGDKQLLYYGNVNIIVLPTKGYMPHTYGEDKIFKHSGGYNGSKVNNTVTPGTNTSTGMYEDLEGYPIMISLNGLKSNTNKYPDNAVPLSQALNMGVTDSDDPIYNWRRSVGFNVENNNNNGLFKGINSRIIVSSSDENPEKLYDAVGVESVLMKYKSTPHYVFKLPKPGGAQSPDYEDFLPFMKYGSGQTISTDVEYQFTSIEHVTSESSRSVDTSNIPYINMALKNPYAYLWMGEVYRPEVSSRFGGTDDGAKEMNIWLPCGDGVRIYKGMKHLQFDWEEGDTYYQRYECVKTYPFTREDQNQLYDNLSFMVESYVNLAGRYDINIGDTDSLVVVPGVNFNLFNPVYSQTNNFFSYKYAGKDYSATENYPNRIMWTETKVDGGEIDAWTQVTGLNAMDLDGDKGKVTSLNKFSNQLIAFQDNGISLVKYNENVQIATDKGVPVQLANSGKVQGKQYISEKIGCQNKMAITQTDTAIYFMDDNEKAMYVFDGKQVLDLSAAKGMKGLFKNSTVDRLLFDEYMHDIYTIGNYPLGMSDNMSENMQRKALSFNDHRMEYTSFYDYGLMRGTAIIDRNVYSYIPIEGGNRTDIYKMYSGNYCKLFNVNRDYYITFISNQSVYDKVFTNVEFNADIWEGTKITDKCPFDTISTWNEYQFGESQLYQDVRDTTKSMYSNYLTSQPSLRRKFRMWRVNIPRHNRDKFGNTFIARERMRSPWLYIKLSGKLRTKAIMHNLDVHYLEW